MQLVFIGAGNVPPELIIVDPRQGVAIPGTEGQVDTTWGDLFPNWEPSWIQPNEAFNQYESLDPTLDFTDSETLRGSVEQWALKDALEKRMGEVPDGKCLHIEIWQEKRKFNEAPPGPAIDDHDFLCTAQGGDKVKTYEYWHTSLPTFNCPPDVIPLPAYCAGYPQEIETINFNGASPLYVGPPFFIPHCGGGVAIVIGYRDDCSSGGSLEPLPISNPVPPPTIPEGVPLPDVPAPVTLTGGVTYNVPPGEPGTVDLSPDGDGWKIDIGVPAPVLTGGTVENVGDDPGYVELEPSEDGYVVNLKVPCPCDTGGAPLKPYTILEPKYEPNGRPGVQPRQVMIPDDGENSEAPLWDALFRTLYAMSNGWYYVPPQTQIHIAHARPVPVLNPDVSEGLG